jgi:hypothetical protein
MKTFLLACALALAATPALSDEIPFADPMPKRGQAVPTVVPSLADFMIDAQLRHIKLWYAAQSRNWPLADFELNRMRETLLTAGMLYINIPAALVIAVDHPISAMLKAVEARDLIAFNEAYGKFTEACNSCHGAGGIGFIRIQVPNASPFSDQIFQPTQ